jgi:peptidyl-prolyl cis-trans isomerase A (cyclophilin A)
MFCPACAKQIPDESKFCLGCGRSMSLAPNAATPNITGGSTKPSFGRRHVVLGCIAAVGLACAFYYLKDQPLYNRSVKPMQTESVSPASKSPSRLAVEPGPESVSARVLTTHSLKVSTTSVETLLPAGAKIIETADISKPKGKSRVLILWMLHPTRHSGSREYCGTTVDGDYWEGPANLSLMDSTGPRILSTVAIAGRGEKSFRLPFFVSNTYYNVPQPNAEKKGVPEILHLQDLNGDGVPSEFVLFMYDACGMVSTGVLGYDSRADRVLQYPIEVQNANGSHLGLWAEQIFAAKSVRPGYWNFTWAPGHGADYQIHEEVSFDAVRQTFIEKQVTVPSGSPNAPPEHPALLNPSALNAQAPETFTTKFSTTKGDITIQVTRSWAPRGADRFYNLVRAGFFTDAAFFRVLRGFMAQFGISAQPDVAQAWANAAILDDPVTRSNKRGTVTFANRGPNTRTTQIFINSRDNAALDSQSFAPFGQVIEGMEIVDRFYAGYGEAPQQDRMNAEGKSYLEREFPNLDRIVTVK